MTAKIIHNINDSELVKEGCTSEQLIAWYNNEDIINDFIGFVEEDKAFLNLKVPASFPDAYTPKRWRRSNYYNL